MSPLSRTLKHFRDRGWFAERTEHWNSFTKHRVDLFNFADAICFNKDEVLLVQTTSGGNVSARIAKIMGLQAAHLWLESPHRRIVVHGWSKRGARGKRKVWSVREEEIAGS